MQAPYPTDPSPSSSSSSVLGVPVQSAYPETDDSDISLRKISSLIRRRWWIILLVAIATGGWFIKGKLEKPPVYQTSFQLLISQPKKIARNSLLDGIEALSLLQGVGAASTSDDYFQTQQQILRSNTLLNPVWKNLSQSETAAGRPWMAYSQFVNNIGINRVAETGIFEISFRDSDQERVKRVLEALAATYLDFTKNEQARLEEEKLGFVNEQLSRFRDKTEVLQRQLIALQKRHQFFDPTAAGQSLFGELSTILKLKSELETQTKQLQTKKQFLESQTGISNSTEAFNVSSFIQSPIYTALIGQLTQIEVELAKAQATYTNKSPQVQELKEQQNSILALIQEEVKRQPIQTSDAAARLQSPDFAGPRAAALQELATTGAELERLTIQLTSLRERETQLQQQLQTFTSAAGQYTAITQELALQRKALDQFLEAKQSLEIELFNNFTPWRKITEIQLPNAPLSNLPRDILQSILIGLIAGGAVAFLVDKLDPTYHSLDQIQTDLRKTILGNIPFEPKLPSCLKNDEKLRSTGLFESFSKLYSNLFFLGRKQSCRAFVITSAESQDGKSTVAFFLAQAASKLGQKVLLVDGDRYFPQEKSWKALASIANSGNHPSSEVDSSSSESPTPSDEAQPEPLSDKLFYYKVPDKMMNPDQLVSSSQKFDRQMRVWRENFDLILIDTPPLLGLTDSRLIADQTDGVLLVVRLEKTRKESIKGALEELLLADLNILGIVVNGVKASSGGYGYYSNYYNRYYRKYALSQAKQDE